MRSKYNGMARAYPPIFIHNTLNSYDLMKETEIGFQDYDSDELIFWPAHVVAALGSVEDQDFQTTKWRHHELVPDNSS